MVQGGQIPLCLGLTALVGRSTIPRPIESRVRPSRTICSSKGLKQFQLETRSGGGSDSPSTCYHQTCFTTTCDAQHRRMQRPAAAAAAAVSENHQFKQAHWQLSSRSETRMAFCLFLKRSAASSRPNSPKPAQPSVFPLPNSRPPVHGHPPHPCASPPERCRTPKPKATGNNGHGVICVRRCFLRPACLYGPALVSVPFGVKPVSGLTTAVSNTAWLGESIGPAILACFEFIR